MADKYVMQAIKELSADLKSNKYESGELQFTDVTNSNYFIKAYGNRLRYCKLWNKFLIWNGSCWEIDNNGTVEEWVLDFIHCMYRGIRVIKDPRLAAAFEKHLIRSESYRKLQSLIGICQMSKEIKVSDTQLDTHHYIFNTKNCSMNLLRGKEKECDIKDLSTKCSSFIYDKDALCPNWDKFLCQIFNNDMDLIHFIQKAVGYALTGDISEQCLFILWGTGANGKSTFLNVLQELFGDYACSAATDTFMHKHYEQSNDIARLRGMRLVTTSEVEQGKALSESLIKQITGEDVLTARFLYGEYFSFKPTFKIFMATNHKPRITGCDEGIWRRIKLIPFTVTISKADRDKDLTKKLIAENSGIFNWVLKGYNMWKKEGLNEPQAVVNANAEFRFDMDSVGSFVKDVIVSQEDINIKLSNKALYDAYVKWCKQNNEYCRSQKGLALRLQEKGFMRGVSGGIRFWAGMSINPDWL